MSDEITDSIGQLRFLVACRCGPEYTGRRLHEPNSIHEYAEDVEALASELDRLRAVEKAAAALVEIRRGGARTGAGTAQEQAAWNQLGAALNGGQP